GRTFTYGSVAPTPKWSSGGPTTLDPNGTAPGAAYAPTGDGEDFFFVNQLQSMNVASGHTLTLDGQDGTDTYTINTTGSQPCFTGDAAGATCHNYVVNVLDTGLPNSGVDNLIVNGFDNPACPTGYLADGVTNCPIDDIFLLRKTTFLASPTTPTVPNAFADDPAFVAVLHGQFGQANPLPSGLGAGISAALCVSSPSCNPFQTFIAAPGTFTGLTAGQEIQLAGGNSGIWGGTYTVSSVTGGGSMLTVSQILPTGVSLTTEEVPTSDVQLAGVTFSVLSNDVRATTGRTTAVERINYDTGINGRLTVNGLG